MMTLYSTMRKVSIGFILKIQLTDHLDMSHIVYHNKEFVPFFKLSCDLFSPVWLTRSRGTVPVYLVVTAETSLNRLRI